MTDSTKNPQTTDNDMESKAVEKLNEQRNREPVSPTPTTESDKAPEDNELNDNEKKAENELAELKRTNELGITTDHHKEAEVKEQLEYERQQKQQRADGVHNDHPEVAHGNQVTDSQHQKLS